MNHAEYAIILNKPDYYLIIDTGHNHAKTITNDSEHVVKELYDEFDLGDRRVFYIDSEDRIDELLHNKGKFVDYKVGHEGIEFPHISEWIVEQITLMDDHELDQVWKFIKENILWNV